MKKLLSITAILLIAFITLQCSTVAVTGRRQLSLVPNSQLLPMSFQQYNQVMKEGKKSDNAQWERMVKNVGANIKGAVERYMAQQNLSSKLNGFAWEFNLLEENVVNAWCMPGGKVAFYTGIMPICRDEAGVAVVMGHEVAHAIANHGGERMSQGLVTQGLTSTFSALASQNPTMAKNLLLQSMGVGSQLGMLTFSRKHESEADELGLIFMAIAGYDPREAPKFWKRMEANSGGGQRPPEFLSTHPHPSTRIADLNSLMPKALKYYKK